MGVVVICYARLCATKDKILITTKLRYFIMTWKNTSYVFGFFLFINIFLNYSNYIIFIISFKRINTVILCMLRP